MNEDIITIDYSNQLDDIEDILVDINTSNVNYYSVSTSHTAIIADKLTNIDKNINITMQFIVIIILIMLFKYVKGVIR